MSDLPSLPELQTERGQSGGRVSRCLDKRGVLAYGVHKFRRVGCTHHPRNQLHPHHVANERRKFSRVFATASYACGI